MLTQYVNGRFEISFILGRDRITERKGNIVNRVFCLLTLSIYNLHIYVLGQLTNFGCKGLKKQCELFVCG